MEYTIKDVDNYIVVQGFWMVKAVIFFSIVGALCTAYIFGSYLFRMRRKISKARNYLWDKLPLPIKIAYMWVTLPIMILWLEGWHIDRLTKSYEVLTEAEWGKHKPQQLIMKYMKKRIDKGV